jgi:hypothetical protein
MSEESTDAMSIDKLHIVIDKLRFVMDITLRVWIEHLDPKTMSDEDKVRFRVSIENFEDAMTYILMWARFTAAVIANEKQ